MEQHIAEQPQTYKARPARAIWVMVYSIASTAKHCLLTLYHAFFSKKDPVKLRRKVDGVIYRWALSLVKAVKLNWVVKGDFESQIKPERCIIILSNHSSAYDIPLLFAALPGSIRMISKKELFKIPLLSRAMKAAEILSIDRQNRLQAMKDLAVAKEKMESGIRICMFPEGTRSETGELLPLKKGAIRLALDTDALIIPVAIQDIHQILPNKKWLQMQLKQKVRINVGQAIDCKNFDVEDRNELRDKVYNSLKTLLNDRS